MQGASLRPLWEDEKQVEKRKAFVEGLALKNEKKALRDWQHKYIITMSVEQVEKSGRKQVPKKTSQVELYNLVDDPAEQKQLIGNGEQHDERAKICDSVLRKAFAGQQAEATPVELDSKLLKSLRGLGYVE